MSTGSGLQFLLNCLNVVTSFVQLLHKEVKDMKADCVLHDGAPNVGTAWIQDAFSQGSLSLPGQKY